MLGFLNFDLDLGVKKLIYFVLIVVMLEVRVESEMALVEGVSYGGATRMWVVGQLGLICVAAA
jgi:hypothetical protein